jgi:hypothetical protein
MLLTSVLAQTDSISTGQRPLNFISTKFLETRLEEFKKLRVENRD